jgi:hypothetical protein
MLLCMWVTNAKTFVLIVVLVSIIKSSEKH